MARRIERHRRDRPDSWQTLEVAEDLAAVLRRVHQSVVLLDCLTFVVSSAVLKGEQTEDAAVARSRRAVEALLGAARGRNGHLLVVTSEVGMGVVPPTEVGRWFRDAQGWANQRVARETAEVVGVVSGMPVRVKG